MTYDVSLILPFSLSSGPSRDLCRHVLLCLYYCRPRKSRVFIRVNNTVTHFVPRFSDCCFGSIDSADELRSKTFSFLLLFFYIVARSASFKLKNLIRRRVCLCLFFFLSCILALVSKLQQTNKQQQNTKISFSLWNCLFCVLQFYWWNATQTRGYIGYR